MIIVPFLVIFLLTGWGGEANRYISLTLFVVASVTDWFDGYLARKNNLVTNFGKFMDPLADKLLVCSAMICMIDLKRLPAWFVIIIIAREFIISGFRLIAAENGIVIAANYWGKFKTASQMIMIILLILHFDGIFVILEQIFIWLSLALTIISLITYIWQNRTCSVHAGIIIQITEFPRTLYMIVRGIFISVSCASDLQYGQFWTLPVEFFLLSSLQGPLKFHFVKNAVHSFFRKQQHSLNMASCLTRFFHCPFLQGSAAYLIWFCQFLSASDRFSSHHSSPSKHLPENCLFIYCHQHL